MDMTSSSHPANTEPTSGERAIYVVILQCATGGKTELNLVNDLSLKWHNIRVIGDLTTNLINMFIEEDFWRFKISP